MQNNTLKNRMQKETIATERRGISWNTTVFMALFHIGAVAALFTFKWQALVVAIVLWWMSASLGVGMGCHASYTSRAFGLAWIGSTHAPRWSLVVAHGMDFKRHRAAS